MRRPTSRSTLDSSRRGASAARSGACVVVSVIVGVPLSACGGPAPLVRTGPKWSSEAVGGSVALGRSLEAGEGDGEIEAALTVGLGAVARDPGAEGGAAAQLLVAA